MKKPLVILTTMVLGMVGVCADSNPGPSFGNIPLSTLSYSEDDPLGRKAIDGVVDSVKLYRENVTFLTNIQTMIVRTCDTNYQNDAETIEKYVQRQNLDGVTIDAPFGYISLLTNDEDGEYDKVVINGLTLRQIIAKETKNPLYGKKLAIVGDSQSCTPGPTTCYAGLITKRNNMSYSNSGVGSTMLVNTFSNKTTGVVYPAIIDSYKVDIPSDSDFILIQAGYNDQFDRTVNDESLDRNTFKGCWNLLLSDLKHRYPNATCGIMLPYSWYTNRIERVEWMKKRCDKYGYEYFDQTPLFTTNQVQYFESGAAFGIHLSHLGARKVSYYIEDWMKKSLNIYNEKLYK